MTLNEALRTPWKHSGKTLEEALRAREVTFKDLRVAANVKETSREQEAARAVWTDYDTAYARVFPQSLTIYAGLPNAKLSLEEARREAYPFSGRNKAVSLQGKPMGRLLDEGHISHQDLGFCLDTSRNSRTREAARVLLFKELQASVRETVDRGSPEVVSGGESWSREQLDLFHTWLGVVAGIGGGIAIGSTLTPWLHGWPLAITGYAVTIFGGIGYALLRMKSIRSNTIGLQEEADVLSILRAQLDSRWTIFTNVRPKGYKGGDLDAVLVGPPGVFVLEIKHWNTDVVIRGESIETKTAHTESGKASPMTQAKGGAAFLHTLLAKKGLKQFVTPVVVMNAKSLKLDKPDIEVWESQLLPEELAELNESEQEANLEIEKVRATLKALFQ